MKLLVLLLLFAYKPVCHDLIGMGGFNGMLPSSIPRVHVCVVGVGGLGCEVAIPHPPQK